jgi:sialate O-acetylesterase
VHESTAWAAEVFPVESAGVRYTAGMKTFTAFTILRPLAFTITAALASLARAEIRLPALVGDHMVLQREANVRLWGWGRPGEAVSVTPSWSTAPTSTQVNPQGAWEVIVQTPAAGTGPQTITIKGDNSIVLRDVLLGEVWVCSGQSNMQWGLGSIGKGRDGVASAETEVKNANYPDIRLFTVDREFRVQNRADCKGTWQVCTPETAKDFSAVGYFFGRGLQNDLKVPIGLISANWGGTPVEAWMSPQALGEHREFASSLAFLKSASDPSQRTQFVEVASSAWWSGVDTIPGDNGSAGADWAQPSRDISSWSKATLPANIPMAQFDGIVYYRKEVNLPASWAGKEATLELGPIDDRDEAFFNGSNVGGNREDGRWNLSRNYTVPASVVTSGRCVVAVKVFDTGGIGGINGKPDQLLLRSSDPALPPISLAGEWSTFTGPAKSKLPPLPESVNLNPSTPSVLYQGLIAPVTPMVIRGVIWYQGESNVGRAEQYQRLFPAMIEDWRRTWDIGDFPFYFVQIAPYKYDGSDQAAFLREAQLKSLATPNTGMVCALDLGNPADIHPDNKQEVGRRLAQVALAQTFLKSDLPAFSPVPDGHVVQNGSIRVQFMHANGSLKSKGDLRGFTIAGEDKQFYEAKAVIDGETVVVSSPRVAKPVAVRYAWEAAPTPTLFSASDLPVTSFRTDDWNEKLPPVMDAGRTSYLTDDPAFTPLFNGKDLSGWVNVNTGPSTWKVKDGMIACSGVPTGVLRTTKQYESFILEMEFRHLVSGGNAGLFVWSDALCAKGQPFTRSIEVQVMDGREGDWYTSDGDIFPIHGATMTPENPRKTGGSRAFPTEKRMNLSPNWNHYRVECVNGTISLAVNGKVVTRGKDISPRKGYVCLESEGSPIDFRNIKIKELPPASPAISESQIATADEGFVSLFNGENFDGWKYTDVHRDHWKINDWTLAFDGQGDHLWSSRSFKDFTLICDWRWTGKGEDVDRPVILPSGEQDKNPDGSPKTVKVKDAGDSGIYLRGNDKSQVNIWCWPCGSGEVYGYRTDPKMPPEVRAGVTPKVNVDAPIGSWNRFVITMKGDRLTVNLNGKTVLNNAHLPGVPAEGPIALQMHGGALEFANISIKELK